MARKDEFIFKISLSVLDHLGRNLYRSFATVLGEAISNSWDADADNVWIYVDKEKNSLLVKDDGAGMTTDDFQNKFLKIGYSKRKDGTTASQKGRPFIGRKGIGKLALLSCADKITVVSKAKGGEYVGGVIDNSGLNKAITDDLTPQEYPLGIWDIAVFGGHLKDHEHGTVICFENMKEGIRSSPEFLRKIIALYFRFSLLDGSFNIFLDGKKITVDDLDDLAEKTEFAWNINGISDPYIKEKLVGLKEPVKIMKMNGKTRGFIASVGKPRDLKITSTDERVGVDLFVNGRLREHDILKHIPTARVAENYLYGQIHFDELDDEQDRFTSSREGVVADDPKYKSFLEELRKKILEIVADWDKWRIKHREDGDPENEDVSRKDRKSLELYNAVSEEFDLPKDSENKKKVDGWVDALQGDATFNLGSYAECFISENLVRNFIEEKKIPLSKEAKAEVAKWKRVETDTKNKGNISIDVREADGDLSYLSMDDLSYMVDKRDPNKEACLARDANEYKPIRDAVAHTALLTEEAKNRLTAVYANIRGRIRNLLSGK